MTHMTQHDEKQTSPYTRWLVVAAGFLCMVVAAGIGWYTFPIYLTSIQSDMGWSRTQLSFAVAVWAIAGGLFSPLAGTWIDKYGARKVMTYGTIAQIVAGVLLSRITTLWHMYLLFSLSSLANIANTYIPVSTAISQWFDEKRGMAMGVAMLGMGCGGFVIPVLANVFLQRYGWRSSYLIFSFFLVALLIPINLWIREKPVSDGDTSIESEPASAELAPNSLSLAESARTRSFWSLGVGDFLISIVVTGVIIHMVAFTTDAGVSQSSATTAYGTFLSIQSLGILLFGALADKFRIRWLMIFGYGMSAVAMVFLFRLQSLWLLYTFAIIFGICAGGRSALWPLALGECFGVAHIGAIFGWLNIPFMIGNGVGPYIAGYIFDTTNSYHQLFVLCVGLSLASAVFISLMRNERMRPQEH